MEEEKKYAIEKIEIEEDEFKRKLEQLKKFQLFIKSQLREGEDYGIVPGSSKPVLLKSGAEILAEAYNFYPVFQIIEKIEDWQKPFFYYQFQCSLFSKSSNQKVAEGYGSANSKEAKWRWRWVYQNQIPKNVQKENLVIQRRQNQHGQWFTLYRIENPEIENEVNTILKIAKKRAFIDAVLSATRSSAIFTQDIEDTYQETEVVDYMKMNMELLNKLGKEYWQKWKEEEKIDKSKLKDLTEAEQKLLYSYLTNVQDVEAEEIKEKEV